MKEIPSKKELFIRIANNSYVRLEAADRPGLEGIGDRLVKMKLNSIANYEDTQKRLRIVLDGIIQKREITDSEELQYFIQARERLAFVYRVENGKLVRDNSIKRGVFFPVWFRLLSINFIDYLADPRSDTRRIKKCTSCGEYFIASHLKKEVCSDDCRGKRKGAWQRDFMKKKRDKKGPDFDPKYIR